MAGARALLSHVPCRPVGAVGEMQVPGLTANKVNVQPTGTARCSTNVKADVDRLCVAPSPTLQEGGALGLSGNLAESPALGEVTGVSNSVPQVMQPGPTPVAEHS